MHPTLPLAAPGAADQAAARAEWLDVEGARSACRSLVRRRALMAATVSFLPLPGVDFIADVAVLVRLLPEINARFGLTEAQVERLSPQGKILAYRLMVGAGAMLASRLSTSRLLAGVLRRTGLRLGAMEASRLVPLAGQGIAAAIAFFALTRMANVHIDECADVVRQLQAAAPR